MIQHVSWMCKGVKRIPVNMCATEIFVRQIQFNIFPIFRCSLYSLGVISYDILTLIEGVLCMQMIPVVSSNLEAIGYDSETQILRVMFKESVYDYFDVPQYEFDNLLNAESKGKYHAAHIKFSYRYKRQ